MFGFRSGFWFAGSAVRSGEGAVFFGRVVPGGVHADDLSVGGELDRPGDQGDLDRAAGPGPASPIHDTGERHCAVGISDAHDRGTDAGAASSALGDRLTFGAVWVGAAALDVGGDQHAGMRDLHQPSGHDDLDRLAGEHSPDPIPEPGHRHLPGLVHPPAHPRRPGLLGDGGRRRGGVGRVGVVSYGCGEDLLREPEPVGRRAHAQALVRPLGVVVDDPAVEGGLQLGDGGELALVPAEEPRPHRLVQPLHLARGGRRVRRGQQVPDPVLRADPIKAHRSRAQPEPGCEHLAVVSQDLLRHPVLAQRRGQRVTHRPGRGPADDLGADHEPGVVIDPGDHLHLAAIAEVDTAHHVHLPQLHRPAPLPPPEVRPPPPALGRLQQPVTDQGPIPTRPARHRHETLPGQLIADSVRPPVPVLPPQPDHPHLGRRRHLMRTRPRPTTAVDQIRQPTISRIPAQPPVHRLPAHPIPARHHRHRRSIQHLEDRPIPLFGHAQLHQHRSPPRPRPERSRQEESPAAAPGSVTHPPELLSHTYRNRVPKLSPSNRNPSDHHEPETHSS
jgi:hypothetical protein